MRAALRLEKRKLLAGKVKQAIGKAVGDQKTVADGKKEAAEAKVQNAFGRIKDNYALE